MPNEAQEGNQVGTEEQRGWGAPLEVEVEGEKPEKAISGTEDGSWFRYWNGGGRVADEDEGIEEDDKEGEEGGGKEGEEEEVEEEEKAGEEEEEEEAKENEEEENDGPMRGRANAGVIRGRGCPLEMRC